LRVNSDKPKPKFKILVKLKT